MRLMKSKQLGMGTLGLLMSLLFAGLIVTLASKVVPVYLDDYALKRVMSSLDKRPDVETASGHQIRIWIDKGLQTNLIKMQPSELKVLRENGQVVVDIDYERRLNFLYNIDLILTFKHDWKAKNQ